MFQPRGKILTKSKQRKKIGKQLRKKHKIEKKEKMQSDVTYKQS